MIPIMTTSQWLMIPGDVRIRMALEFKLNKSTGVQMLDNRILSDGHTNDDLKAINVESMQSFLGSTETDFYNLLNAVIERLTPPPPEPPEVVTEKPIDIRITVGANGKVQTHVVDNPVDNSPKVAKAEQIINKQVETNDETKTIEEETTNQGTEGDELIDPKPAQESGETKPTDTATNKTSKNKRGAVGRNGGKKGNRPKA